MATVLKQRLERLACDFDLADNYFAWQAFGQRYARRRRAPLPPYLQRERFQALQARGAKRAASSMPRSPSTWPDCRMRRATPTCCSTRRTG